MTAFLNEIKRFPDNHPGSDPIHVGVVFPNVYPVAVASLGYQTVHLIAHNHPGVIAHRIVLEIGDRGNYIGSHCDDRIPPANLDVILASIPFEIDYIHFVRFLNGLSRPVLRRDRGQLPLVIAGGIAPTANPEPLAKIVDAVLVGAGEINIPGTLDDILEVIPLLRGPNFKSGLERLYEMWDERDGVYVPELWSDRGGSFESRGEKKVRQAFVENLDEHTSCTPVVSPDGVYGAKNLVEISRGCPTHCRFCLLSHICTHETDRSIDSVLENARMFTPDEATVGLISSKVSDHPDIVEIIDELTTDGYSVSLSSLKVSSTTPELLESLFRSGTKSVTFAPEHGSEKILKLINKPYTYDDVADRVNRAFDAGITKVKLYFLTGFEEETDEDMDCTVDYIKSLVTDTFLTSRKINNKMTIGLAPFVPKASTPFQRRPMQSERELKRKIRRFTNAMKGVPRLDLEIESARVSVLQGILSMGGREIGEILVEVSKTRESILASWDNAAGKVDVNAKEIIMNPRPSETTLPWSFIKR